MPSPVRSSAAVKGLYRSILRAHERYLPAEMRELGTTYARSEFKLHKTVTKEDQLQQFFTAWEDYLDQLKMTALAQESLSSGAIDEQKAKEPPGSTVFLFGQDLPADVQLTDEQLEQLEKLKEEATKPR